MPSQPPQRPRIPLTGNHPHTISISQRPRLATDHVRIQALIPASAAKLLRAQIQYAEATEQEASRQECLTELAEMEYAMRRRKIMVAAICVTAWAVTWGKLGICCWKMAHRR
jgi:hypothetical protein